MEALTELVQLLTRNKLKGLKMKDIALDQDTKMALLYQGIADGKYHSEEDANSDLFPETDGLANIRYVKKELQNRLLNYLFFIDLDLPSFTDRQKAYLQCHKKWAIINLLLGRGARMSAIKFAEKLIKNACKYEFTEIVADVSKQLRFHFGGIVGDKNKFFHYRKLYEQYEQYYVNENRIEATYTDIVFAGFNPKVSKDSLQEMAEEATKKIEAILANTPTYKAQLYGYLMQVMTFSNTLESEKLVKICNEAILFFEQKDYQAFTPLQIFYYQKLIAYTQLRKFDEGKMAAEKCLTFLEEGTFNWFRYNEAYFTLAMHTKNYTEAYLIFSKIINHPRMGAIPDSIAEIWKIYEAFLFLLYRAGYLDDNIDNDNELSKFRLGRFMNDIPHFSKEKQGLNIAILSIQVLLFIQSGKPGKAIDRIEALEKYATRYLRTEETLRSYYFIKMLVAIPKHSFHKAAVLRHTDKWREKLENFPLEMADQDHKIEVIPYEDLWQISIAFLKNKFHHLS